MSENKRNNQGAGAVILEESWPYIRITMSSVDSESGSISFDQIDQLIIKRTFSGVIKSVLMCLMLIACIFIAKLFGYNLMAYVLMGVLLINALVLYNIKTLFIVTKDGRVVKLIEMARGLHQYIHAIDRARQNID